MDDVLLKNCTLFAGLTTKELRDDLSVVPQHIQFYEKDEIIFHFMEQDGIIAETANSFLDNMSVFQLFCLKM